MKMMIVNLPNKVPPNKCSNAEPSAVLMSSFAQFNQSFIDKKSNGKVTCPSRLYFSSA